jgi:STE24 endopeptidase
MNIFVPPASCRHEKIVPAGSRRYKSVMLLLFFIFAAYAASGFCQTQTQTQTEPGKNNVTRYTLPPEKYHKAVEYAKARYRIYFISSFCGVALLLILLALKIGSRYRNIAEKVSANRFAQAWIFVPLLLLTLAILSLPLDLYGQSLALKYDQSVQSWSSWMWDWTKGQLLSFAIMSPILWILYLLIRKSAHRWWFYFWLISLPIIVFLLFITPVLIEPLFFKFQPLTKNAPNLVTQIERVVQRGGLTIPENRMFEMLASEKLKSVNAYVTGFGASKRVVVWDTTIARMTIPETLFVFGHEMGHYVLNHIPKTIVFVAVVLFVFLYVGYHGMNRVLARWSGKWEIRSIDDWASLPVLMLLLAIFSFIATPIFSSYSRQQEHEADIYGLEITHGIIPDSSKVAAQAFQILGEINLSDPNPSPFIKVWLYDHPPLNERVEFAATYDPWSKGESPKFVK